MSGEFVAFYGTLMSGLPPRPGRPPLAPHIELLGPCRIPGALYDVGPYPCLVRGPGAVRGELWRTTSDEALAVLDAWEGVEMAREVAADYVRERVRLLEPTDTDAWVYAWDAATIDGLTPIPHGDYGRWVRELDTSDKDA